MNQQPLDIRSVVKMLEGQDEKQAVTERNLEEMQRKLDLILTHMEKKEWWEFIWFSTVVTIERLQKGKVASKRGHEGEAMAGEQTMQVEKSKTFPATELLPFTNQNRWVNKNLVVMSMVTSNS